MAIPTVAQTGPGPAYRAEASSAVGRWRLPALLLASLALHAAAIGLWPEGAAVISEPLPAGPIALRLQSAAAGGGQSAAPTEVKRSAPNAVTAQAAARTPPRTIEATPRIEQRTSIPQPAGQHAAVRTTTTAAPPAAAAAAAAAATTGTQNTDGLQDRLRHNLQSALIAHFDYPLVARRRGWEGIVRVGLRIEADGQLTRLRVVESSGHVLLDRAALKSLGRVGKLPDAQDWQQGRWFDMVLPVRYQLIDS